MSRVSEFSNRYSSDFAINKAKRELEDLHFKGANLKQIQKPSDNPNGQAEVLATKSIVSDNTQFLENQNMALAKINFTENALSDLTELIVRAKELAIQQASGFYHGEQRRQVAEEISQIRNAALSIANRRWGNQYIFSGHKTLTPAFDENGNYHGDDGKVQVEIAKDFFIPSNVNGLDAFYGKAPINIRNFNPKIWDNEQLDFNEEIDTSQSPGRSLAGVEDTHEELAPYEVRYTYEERRYPAEGRTNIFNDLKSLRNALASDNPELVQDLLERLDEHHNRIVMIRTKLGGIQNSLDNSQIQVERDTITQETKRSKIEDVDVAELMSELQRQQHVLTATYKTSNQLLNNSLIDFIMR